MRLDLLVAFRVTGVIGALIVVFARLAVDGDNLHPIRLISDGALDVGAHIMNSRQNIVHRASS